MKRLLLCAVALSALLPAAAHANPVSGELKRGAGENELRAELRNDGSTANDFLRLELASGTIVDGVATPGCSPAGDQVQCDLGDRFAGGATFVIDFTTRSRYAAGAGADVFVCPRPCGGRDAGPFRIAGPNDLSGADLQVTMETAPIPRVWLFGPSQDDDIGIFIRVSVTNHGPATAGRSSLVIRLDRAPASAELRAYEPCLVLRGARQPPPVECIFASLRPGETETVTLSVYAAVAASVPAVAEVRSVTPDPGPRPNAADIEATLLPVASKAAGLSSRLFEGTATPGADVEAALLMVGSGLRPYAPTCRWVTRRGRFRREQGPRCERPVWLRAQRAGRRWRLRLARRLRPGRYVLYTRARRGGTCEVGFVPGVNRREFIVRRR